MIQNKEVLEQIREEAVKELNSYDCRILVCSGTGLSLIHISEPTRPY